MLKKLKPLPTLYFTQFLSAFADNMVLFIILEILKNKGIDAKYLVAIGIAFLLPYVLLAPFVGTFADKKAKSTVLLWGNIFKCVGVGGLLIAFLQIIPMTIPFLLICYFIIGIGAVVYSPAKYGILTELTSNEQQLLKANANIEGTTIFAIMGGTVVGGIAANASLKFAIISCIFLYILSIVATFVIPKVKGNEKLRYLKSFSNFFVDMKILFKNKNTQYSLIGTGAFWQISYVLRTAIILWIPIHLSILNTDKISMISGITAVGIIIGALSAPYLTSLKKFYNCYLYALGIVIITFIFPFVYNFTFTVILLLLVGFFGGVFVIPINTILQEHGSKLVGSGKVIAIQNFLENIMMLIGAGLFTVMTSGKIGLSIDGGIVVSGALLLALVLFLISRIKYIKN